MTIFDKEQVYEAISETRTKIDTSSPRYNLPGSLDLVISVCDLYGLTLDKEKTEKLITHKVVDQIMGTSQTHFSGAVLILQGEYTIDPVYRYEATGGRNEIITFFIEHQTLNHKYLRQLASELLNNNCISGFEGLDVEYLYEIMTESTEDRLIKYQLDHCRGLPIYTVKFDGDGLCTIQDMGVVGEKP